MQAYKRGHKTSPVNKDPQRRGLSSANFDYKRQAPVHPRKAYARALAKIERAGGMGQC